MPHIYRQKWQRLENGHFVLAGYSFHFQPETIAIYEAEMNKTQVSKSPLDRLYIKGVPCEREVSTEFFNQVKAKAERSLVYGIFLKADPSQPVTERSVHITLSELFSK